MLLQFIKFAGVGGIGTAVHYVTLIALVEVVNVQPIFASTLGMVLGANTNYFLNYRLTFRSNTPHQVAMPRFFLIASIGLMLNAAIMVVAINTLCMRYIVAQLFATGLVLAWNFFANRVWTFQERDNVCH